MSQAAIEQQQTRDDSGIEADWRRAGEPEYGSPARRALRQIVGRMVRFRDIAQAAS